MQYFSVSFENDTFLPLVSAFSQVKYSLIHISFCRIRDFAERDKRLDMNKCFAKLSAKIETGLLNSGEKIADQQTISPEIEEN